MQLTRAADYAVRVMTYLAGLPAGARASRHDLASAADAPGSFVSKILPRLAVARLVVARRGKGGGFELAQPPDRLSLLDVITAIEGPLCLNACLRPGGCHRQPQCGAHPVWAQAQARLAAVLQSASLEDLARHTAARTAHPGVNDR